MIVPNLDKLRVLTNVLRMLTNWQDYLAVQANLSRRDIVKYRFRNNCVVAVRRNTYDTPVVTEVLFHRVYAPPGFEVERNDVVLDIGAHIGSFSIYAAGFAHAAAVYSFEPEPSNFEMLCKNVMASRLRNVSPINSALSSCDSERDLNVSRYNTGRNSFYFSEMHESRVRVKTMTLASFFQQFTIRKVDFAKIDCEGSEYDILYGCPADILNRIRKIALEVHDLDEKRNGAALAEFLRNTGFKVRRCYNRGAMVYASR